MNVSFYLPIELKLCQNLTESKARKPGQGSFLVHPGEPVVDGKDGGLGGGVGVGLEGGEGGGIQSDTDS